MKKRVLSLLLAAALLGLCVPALAEAPADTPAPTLEPVDTPGETAAPTLEPTDVPEETVGPTAEPSETPGETAVPTLEPTEAPEETVSPTLEPEETPGEAVGPTPEPEATPGESEPPTPDPDGEIMLTAAVEGGKYTLDQEKVTMYSALRPIVLTVKMEPYESNNRNKWTFTSSAPDVVKVEQVKGRDMNEVTKSAQIKLWALKPGTATITVSPASDWMTQYADKYESATCTVEVVQDENTTWGKTLADIDRMGAEAASRMKVYDPRDLDMMTDVNLQIGGICGMEGNIAAMEASVVREGILTKEQADMAERHLVYHYFNRSSDPVGYSNEDAMVNMNWEYEPIYIHPVGAFMTQWNGPIHDDDSYGLENRDGYDNCIVVPEDVWSVYGEVEELKQIIAQYGGIAFGYRSPLEGVMYHYNSALTNGWHCSAIVGWDDTVSREQFQTSARCDGAWIVKNSWGDKHGDGHGYFYLSYDAGMENAVTYKMMLRSKYDFNYFYDGVVENKEYQPFMKIETGAAAVSFQAKMAGAGQSEYLEAVNVGVNAGTEVTVEVYTDVDPEKLKGDAPDPTWGYKQPAATGHRSVPGQGFFTVKLGHAVKLEKGKYFTVVVKVPGGSVFYVVEKSTNDLTFVTTDAGGWKNTHTRNPADRWDEPKTLRIKAFTSVYPDNAAPAPPAITPEPSPTPIPEATATPTPTATPEPTATPAPTATVSPSPSPTATASPTPTATASPTPTATPEPTATLAPTATAEASASPTPTAGHPATSEPFYTPAPSEGTAPPVPVSSTAAASVPDTGDGTPLALYAGLLALCLAGLAAARRRKSE